MESLISLYDSNNEEACKEENDGIEYFYEYSNCFLDNSICFEKNKEIMQLSLYETQRAVIIQWICGTLLNHNFIKINKQINKNRFN